jgi:hypothetical protein
MSQEVTRHNQESQKLREEENPDSAPRKNSQDEHGRFGDAANKFRKRAEMGKYSTQDCDVPNVSHEDNKTSDGRQVRHYQPDHWPARLSS